MQKQCICFIDSRIQGSFLGLVKNILHLQNVASNWFPLQLRNHDDEVFTNSAAFYALYYLHYLAPHSPYSNCYLIFVNIPLIYQADRICDTQDIFCKPITN